MDKTTIALIASVAYAVVSDVAPIVTNGKLQSILKLVLQVLGFVKSEAAPKA